MRVTGWFKSQWDLPVSCQAFSETSQQAVCLAVGQCQDQDLTPGPLHPYPCPESVHHSQGGSWAAALRVGTPPWVTYCLHFSPVTVRSDTAA